MELILASNSPRRRELLARLTSDFSVIRSHVDESAQGAPPQRVIEVARAKARAVGGSGRGVIIGADTVVVLDGELLGKPGTRDRAEAMLRRLSGREHSVLTGLCVWDTETDAELLPVFVSRVPGVVSVEANVYHRVPAGSR